MPSPRKPRKPAASPSPHALNKDTGRIHRRDCRYVVKAKRPARMVPWDAAGLDPRDKACRLCLAGRIPDPLPGTALVEVPAPGRVAVTLSP